MAGTYCDAEFVENGADIVGMRAFQQKGDHTGFIFGGADETHPLDF